MMEAIDNTYGSNLSDAGLDIGDYPTNYPDGIWPLENKLKQKKSGFNPDFFFV